MIHQQATRTIRFLRTTAIGGIFFLLPLIVVGALIGQLVPVVWAAAGYVQQYVPAQTPVGYAILFLCGVAILVGLCFVAGLAARRAVGKKFTERTEKYLLMLFPRYAIFKEQLSGNIGGHEFQNSMKPVTLKFADYHRIALEIERSERGEVVVFLPGSPDPWTGTVVVVSASQVMPLNVDFGDALASFEQLGRKTLSLLDRQFPS
ncbi:MAG: hypothetical protein KDB22_25675 [Planctomycetales bacterium]|nr:hypothetical protein [Planctomycetales bacterium]